MLFLKCPNGSINHTPFGLPEEPTTSSQDTAVRRPLMYVFPLATASKAMPSYFPVY